MDRRRKTLRRSQIFDCISSCDTGEAALEILVDKIISLEDELAALQAAFIEKVFKEKSLYNDVY